MTITSRSHAGSPVAVRRDTGHHDDSPPAPPARPFPQVPGVTHRFVTARGVRLHVAEPGDGEPIVLLHGFPQHWYAWRHVIPLLAGEYRLICADLRGFGWSDAPPRGYDTASRVADVLALMDSMGLHRVRLIGHDWGGRAAVMLALQAPERVSHLLALNTAHPWLLQRRLLPQLWRFWYTAFLEYPRIGRLVLRNWPGFTRFLLLHGAADPTAWPYDDVEEFVTASRGPASSRAGEALHWQFVLHDIPAMIMRKNRGLRLTVPTVLLAGADDWMLPPKVLAGAGPHADSLTVQVVPRAGHFLADECPGQVAQVARELFRRK